MRPPGRSKTGLIMLILLLLAAFLGFLLLALAQARPRQRLGLTVELARGPRSGLRLGGALLLALALVLALARDGPGFGGLLWGTAVSLAALAVACTLSWQARLPGRTTGARRPGAGQAREGRPDKGQRQSR